MPRWYREPKIGDGAHCGGGCRNLSTVPPRCQPGDGGAIEEQRIAEQRLNLLFHLRADAGDNLTHLFDPVRAIGKRLQIVADRLLARQF